MTIFISIFTVLEPVIGIAYQFTDRMYKVNRKRLRAPCVSALMYSTSGRSRYPTPELPGARLAEDRHSSDRKLESELDRHIVCAWRGPAALI